MARRREMDTVVRDEYIYSSRTRGEIYVRRSIWCQHGMLQELM